MPYKILLNGTPSVINAIEGDLTDPYGDFDRAFSTGRKAQAVIKAHKKYCVDTETSLEFCLYSIEKGEFVPYPEGVKNV